MIIHIIVHVLELKIPGTYSLLEIFTPPVESSFVQVFPDASINSVLTSLSFSLSYESCNPSCAATNPPSDVPANNTEHFYTVSTT